MKTIVLWNMKGGTGKTTTALNLAFEFSAEGKAVLCIDLDGQCNLTSYFEPRIDRQRPAITEIIMKKQDLASGITHSQYHELDFIAGSEKIGSLAQADSSILSNCLNDIGDLYDFCIIDCHPDFSVITQAAVRASDFILVPILLDGFSRDNLNLVFTNLMQLEEQAGKEFHAAVLANRVRNRKSQRLIYEDIVERHDYPILDTCISDYACVGNALLLRKPICLHRSHSVPAKDYQELAEEVFKKMEGRE